MSRPAYYYHLDPMLVRPNFGGVLSETDWHDETFITTAELRRCIHDHHTDRPRPQPCAPWRTMETA